MLPLLILVHAALPIWEAPSNTDLDELEPADPNFTGGALYVAINKKNGKRYEGETVCFCKRYNKHFRTAFRSTYRDHNLHLYRSIRKYGFENFDWYFRKTFVFEGLNTLSKKQRRKLFKAFKKLYLHPAETFWIRHYGTINRSKGYNLKETGEGGAGYERTPEIRARMSLSRQGLGNKQVTSCQIIEDLGHKQKVIFRKYPSIKDAQSQTGAKHVSKCCHNKCKSSGKLLWWFTTEAEMAREFDGTPEIVSHIQNIPGSDLNVAVISIQPLGNGKAREQWHVSQAVAERTLSNTFNKKFNQRHISLCCSGRRSKHHGHHFRKVTTEKKEHFDKNGYKETTFEPERYWTNFKKKIRNKANQS